MRAVLTCLFLFISLVSAQAAPMPEQHKIDYLINAVEQAPITFIRNGKEYAGKEAGDHLRQKLDYAGDRVQTAEDFITLVASKSYLSGEPYLVKLKDGSEQPSADWLHARLNEFKP